MELKLKSYEMLEEENKELKTVMRKLCHEMGNALTLLGGSIFYLENELKHKSSGEELINLKEDYVYICKLFSNLREYNHTEAIEKENIMLTQIVDNIEDVFDKLNTGNDTILKIERMIDTDNMEIYADITKLRQVIINIIKNSLEAMENNGVDKGKNMVVRISKENIPCSMSHIENKVSQEVDRAAVVHIEIRDNGKGISEENIADIFKPLYTYEKKNGLGLGLAVVKKIVEDHRGKIKAVSVLGTGTAMHIYLPVLRKIKQHI